MVSVTKRKYNRVGHLWQGRYKSYALYDNAHFWIVAKYIERNTIKANMVNDINQSYYQSFFEWKNKSKNYAVIKDSKIFDMTLVEYEDYISTDLEIDAIDIVYKSPKTIIIDGKFKVLSKRIETFFEMDRDINKNNNIKRAFEYGYTKTEIANFLDISKVAVSKIIQK